MTIHVELRDEQVVRLDRFATGLRKSRGEATAQHLQLDLDRVTQALRYASTFESEVLQALDEYRSITQQDLRASLPPGAWVDIR